LIRKLIAAGSVLAVAVVALMVMTVGSGTQSAEAHVQSITGPGSVSPIGIGVANIRVLAQNGHGDVRITASAGGFIDCDYENFNDCNYDPIVSGNALLWNDAWVDDGSGDVDTIDLDWVMGENFDGNAVLFTACQDDQNCPEQAKTFTMQVVGAAASVNIFAGRNYTTESSSCQQTQVYVIAAEEYSFNNATTFDNNRAIICADVRDSAGHVLGNEQVVFTTTDGCFSDTNSTTEVQNTGSNSLAFARLESCGTGNSGDVASIKAQAGGVFSNSITVEFGGDPASCSIPDFAEDLDIGDNAAFTATFVDELGNKIPDGIVAHIVEVDSGDGADNVDIVSETEDTVNSQVTGNVIGAISGLTTIAVSLETLAGADVTCSEALELTGDVHVTPTDCEDPDMILFGNPPPAGGGFGTFAFCGGTWEQLLDASNCPEATSVFFYNTPQGDFEVWIPGSDVAAVNAEILARWPNEHNPIPEGTIFTAKCK
jgi:hypothetical protein